MKNRTGKLGLLLAAALLTIAGCGSSSGETGPTSEATTSSPSSSGSSKGSAMAAAITIDDFAYHGPSTVSPGATVTVKNTDSTAHTLTSDDKGRFDVTVKPGDSATFTVPNKAGSYPYHCEFHANMHGKLVVK